MRARSRSSSGVAHSLAVAGVTVGGALRLRGDRYLVAVARHAHDEVGEQADREDLERREQDQQRVGGDAEVVRR